ncbi:glycosyltransferase family A protein [Desulfopila sp. IMCC35008]|uniref:glycosyltransferase family 2 protein n=1 Tax=Desulfopila sp. IMCC35008 TaxID=2653858 RepID=UPI0013D7A3D7|nr:glycosyltransferase family A protein [Desulfopila sp. IMCC35008]
MTTCPVTTIIPTYNRSSFLGRAIDSVLVQTCKCDELLIIDDGSTDGTKKLVEKYRTDNPQIQYLWQPNNGPASARNLGITRARNPFIAFLDSDDHWHRKKIEKQYGAMVKSPEYLISHTYEKWLRNGQHLNQKKIHIPRHGDIFDHCLSLCAVGMSTVMAQTELFRKEGLFAAELRCCEDYDYWLRVSRNYPFLLVGEPLTIKEGGREDQVSWQYRVGMDKLRITSLVNLLENFSLSKKQRIQACQEAIKKATIYGNGCIRYGKKDEGAQYLCLAADIHKQLQEK